MRWTAAALAGLVLLGVTYVGTCLPRGRQSDPGPSPPRRESSSSSTASDLNAAESSAESTDKNREPSSNDTSAAQPDTTDSSDSVAFLEGSKAAVLADFWGDEWEEAKARLLAKGRSLEGTLRYRPWEEVEPRLAKKILIPDEELPSHISGHRQWQDPLTPKFLEAEFGFPKDLDAVTIEEVKGLVESWNLQIDDLSYQKFAAQNDALRAKWNAGDYKYSPYSTAACQSGLSGSMVSRSAGHWGWAAKISLGRDEFPEIVALDDEIVRLILERNEALLRYREGL